MSGMLNLNDATKLSSVHKWLKTIPQADLDRNLKLDTHNNMSVAPQTVQKPAVQDEKSGGFFSFLWSSSKPSQLQGRVTQPPEDDATQKLSAQIFYMMKKTAGDVREQNLTFHKFMEDTFENVFSPKTKDEAAPALTARTLLNVFDKLYDVEAKASIEEFKKKNPELVRQADDARAKLKALERTLSGDSDFAFRVKRQLEAFENNLNAILEGLKSGLDDDGIELMKTVYTDMVDEGKKLCAEGDKKLLEKATVSADAMLTKSLEAGLAHLSEELDKEFPSDPYMTPEVKKAFVEKFRQKADSAIQSCRADLKKETDAGTSTPDSIDPRAHQTKREIGRAMKNILDEAKAFRKESETKQVDYEAFTSGRASDLSAFKEKLDFEMKAFTERWKKDFGSDPDTQDLTDLLDGFKKEGDALAGSDGDAFKPGSNEASDAYEKRLSDAEKKCKTALDGKYETFRKALGDKIDAEKTVRITKMRNDAISGFDKGTAEIVTAFKKDMAAHFETLAQKVADKGSLADLVKAREETEAALDKLLVKPENDTPEAAYNRQADAVEKVNEAYLKFAIDKHAVLAKNFEAALDSASSRFADEVRDFQQEFDHNWEDAFPKDDKRWMPEMLDNTKAAIKQDMDTAVAAFKADMDRLKISGTKELPENFVEIFETRLAALKDNAKRRLENAAVLEPLRQMNGAGVDGTGGLEGALDRVGGMLGKMADSVSMGDAPDADVDLVREKVQAFSAALIGFRKTLASAADLSPYALSVAQRQIDAFVQSVEQALVRTEQARAKNPAEGTALLKRLLGNATFPTVILKTVDADLADDDFALSADVGNELAALNEKPEIRGKLSPLFTQFKKNVAEKYKDVKKFGDPAAVYAFQQLVRKIYADASSAVNEAVANGVDLSNGIINLFAPGWSEVMKLYNRSAAQKTANDFRSQVAAARARLEQLADNPPKKFDKNAIARRFAFIQVALSKLEAHGWAVNDDILSLAAKGQCPTEHSLGSAVAELNNGVDKFINEINGLGNGKSLAKNPNERHELNFGKTDFRAQEDMTYSGMHGGDYADADALRAKTKEVRATAQELVARKAEDDWGAVLASEKKEIEIANLRRAPGEMYKDIRWADEAEGGEGREAFLATLAEKQKSGAEQIQANARAKKFEMQRKELEKIEQAKKLAEQEKLEKERVRNENIAFNKAKNKWLDAHTGYLKNERAYFSTMLANRPDAPGLMTRNENGAWTGWSPEGEAVILRAMKYLGEKQEAEMRAAFKEGREVAPLAMTPEGRASILDRAFKEIAPVQKAQAQGGAEGKSAYPLGGNLFGLDFKALTPEQQKGARELLKGFAKKSMVRLKKFDTNLDNEYVFQRLQGDKFLHQDFGPLEKAIRAGEIDLAKLSPGEAYVLAAFYANEHSLEKSGQSKIAFGVKEPKAILAALAANGIGPKELASFTNMLNAKRLSEFFGMLRVINGDSVDGLDVACRRVFGIGLAEAVSQFAKMDVDDEKAFFATPLGAKFNAISSNLQSRQWRADVDPVITAKDEEKKAIAMLGMQYAFGSNDKASVAVLMSNIGALERAKPGTEVVFTLSDTNVKLVKLPNGHLSAQAEVTKGSLARDKKGKVTGISYEGLFSKTKIWVPVSAPLSIAAMREKLEAAIASNASFYGADAALTVLKNHVTALGASAMTSSRTRQLAIDILISYAGLTTAKLCLAPTEMLVNLASQVLKDPTYTDLSVADRGKRILSDKFNESFDTQLLNSSSTIELYRDMKNAGSEKVDTVVKMPPADPVRKGETPEQAQLRHVHAFVADLIQPEDTARFDLAQLDNKSSSAILRETILQNREQLEMLLDDKDGKLIDTFTIKGRGGLPLDAFKVELRKLVDALRQLENEAGGREALFDKLGDAHDEATENVLSAAAKGLAETSKAVLGNLQQAFLTEFTQSFEAGMAEFDREPWKKTLDELAKAVKIDPSQGYGGFLKKVMGEYFTRMSEVDRNRMAAQVMRYANSDSSLGEVLGALLKGAGPILQKLMQGLPVTSLPETLRQAVADLRSNLAPIPEEAVKAYLYNAVKESNGQVLSIEVTKSLGAASVGQAFLCIVKTPEHPEGEECVVKVLRPDVQTRAHREQKFFEAVAKDLGLGTMLQTRFERVYDELDLMVEANNVSKGTVYDPEADFRNDLLVRSMKVHPSAHSTTNVLFLRRAPGEPLDRFIETVKAEHRQILAGFRKDTDVDGSPIYYAETCSGFMTGMKKLREFHTQLTDRRDNLAHFATEWMQEIAFGGGFFHGDVHAGNIMVDKTGLTVIDFGNATQLSEQQRSSIKRMLIAAELADNESFVDAFKSFMSPEDLASFAEAAAKKPGENGRVDVTALTNGLDDIFAKGRMEDVGKRFIAALQHLQNGGVKLPGTLFNLMECMLRLDDSIESMNAELAELEKDIGKTIRPDFDVNSERWFDEFMEKKMTDDVYDPVKRIFLEGAIKNAYDDLTSSTVVHEWDGKEKTLLSNVGALFTRIVEGCKTRFGYEKMMNDLRNGLASLDYEPHLNVPARIRDILATAEADPAMFDASHPNHGARLDKFATDLATVISEAQQYMIKATRNFETAAPKQPNTTFADAVGVAVGNNRAQIEHELGLGLISVGVKLRDIFKRESRQELRNYYLPFYIADKKIPATDADLNTAKYVVRNLPFSKRVREIYLSGEWFKDKAKRDQVIAALRETVSHIYKALEHDNRKNIRFRNETLSVSGKIANLAGLCLHVEFDSSPFKGMKIADFDALLRNLDEEDDFDLIVMLKSLYQVGQEPAKTFTD